MRILFFDLDTLRPDHLGCYGYKRNTSENIDRIAKDGVVFDNYYCPNAPCLPSRASLVTGEYGICNGVLGHGGTSADLRLEGENRRFRDTVSMASLFSKIKQAGFRTTSISTFAERHSAWWFNSGLNELINVGKCGVERADEVEPYIMDWLDRNAQKDNWFLHINMWDAHTPYRTIDYPNHFENEPLPDNWINEDVLAYHRSIACPHGAREVAMWDDKPVKKYPKYLTKLENLDEVKYFIDMYDNGIKYMDDVIGRVLEKLEKMGLYNDDLCIIVTSDHGENLGELGLYGEHATADYTTCRIPFIIKWKDCVKDYICKDFHDNVDLLPTICDLLEQQKANHYDGISFYPTLKDKTSVDKGSVILTQCAHVCQRSAIFSHYLYVVTMHGGFHLFDKEMLFDLDKDIHEQHNIAQEHPELCAQGAKLIFDWQNKYMAKAKIDVDPLWTVMREGGPLHAKGHKNEYVQRLIDTGREDQAEKILKVYKDFN